MPSIYTNLKKSDKKHIRTEKARIRRQFLDVAKQEEMITELYRKMVPALAENPKSQTTNPKQIQKTETPKTAKKVATKKKAAVKKVKA